jgi:hypothetical protein
MGTVKISITQEGALTKAGTPASASVVDDAPLNIKKGGHIFFVSDSNTITKYVRILPTAITSGDSETTVGFDQIDQTSGGGATIKNVPSSSKKVYIYLNLPASVDRTLSASLVNGPFTNVTNKLIRANELVDTDNNTYGVDSVAVSGSGKLVDAASGLDYSLQAENVPLRAVASRIEIPRFSPENPSSTSDSVRVTAFTLAGIYINNFYSEVKLGGLYPNDVENTGTNRDAYDSGSQDFLYTDATKYAEYLYTADPAGLGGASTIKAPSGGTVWAYNVFPNDTTGVKTRDKLPHIVFHLSSVTLESGPTGARVVNTLDNQFVTVNGFASANDTITHLERGYVYSFGMNGVKFKPGNVSDEPETRAVSAFVEAKLIKWKKEEITPVY